MPNTAIEYAFEKAGPAADERAKQYAADALAASSGSLDGAVQKFEVAIGKDTLARRAVFLSYLLKRIDDARLEQDAEQKAKANKASEISARAAERGSGTGHKSIENQSVDARPASLAVPVKEHNRRPPNSAQPASIDAPPKARRPERDLSAMDAVLEVARLTFLDTHKVNGVAIGDLTPRELMKAASASSRDSRFYARVAGNLPMDDMVRKWADPDDVRRMWNEEHAASMRERADVDAY